MVDARNYASGKYIDASRLPTDRHVVAVIVAATEELMELSHETKLVLALRSTTGKAWPQKFIPNVTALKHLIAVFGPQTDGWIGKSIECWSEPTRFGADTVMGIKILALNGAGAAQPAIEATATQVPPAPQGTVAPAAQTAPQGTVAPPASAQRAAINADVPLSHWDAPSGGDLDDEIPF